MDTMTLPQSLPVSAPQAQPVSAQPSTTVSHDTAAANRALARKAYVEAFEALKRGATAQDAASRLSALGLDAATAAGVVANVERFKHELGAAYRAAGLKSAGFGLLWCIGGIVVTALTYAAASGGGTFIVAWGAVLFGAIQAVRGLIHSTRRATQDQLIQAFSL
jgi:hypothetical protein